MQLAYIQPLFWIVPTAPEGYVYHINFPGSDIQNPVFAVDKGLPSDQSGQQFVNGTITYIGAYGSFAAAQSACETDFSATSRRMASPIPSPNSPNQPVAPVYPLAPANVTVAAIGTTPVPEAPMDGQLYVRQNGAWVVAVPNEAPLDGKAYDRKSGAWVATVPGEAPTDGKAYVRVNGTWVVSLPGEAPTDGKLYGRTNGTWSPAAPGS